MQYGSLYEYCNFAYDGYGRRTSKSYSYDPNPGSTSDYSYMYTTTYDYDTSGRIVHETCVERYISGTTTNRDILYLYDESGIIGAIQKYNSTEEIFYFDKNIKGDVIGIYNASGTQIAKYSYDAWGNCTTKTLVANSFIAYNPIRYRGYYYDRETKLYYLNARYYDPAWRRFISPDDTAYLDPDTPSGLNLYAYCNNDPVDRYDPTGHAWDTVLDVISIVWSAYDFIKNPSWENAGWLALDIIFAIVPFLTGSKIIKAASKLDEVAYVGKGVNRLDNLYDTVVLGNDMNRVMDRAWTIGATFYGGYGPLNALGAMHDFNSATDAMKYAAKLDNARFIIDKVNDGYKFVHVGSDGRSFIKMMKSAYGMELKILYRLKIGNKLHRIWWIFNAGRRIIW